jgi:hypothetical protein
VVGSVVLVRYHGEPVYARGAGHADRGVVSAGMRGSRIQWLSSALWA